MNGITGTMRIQIIVNARHATQQVQAHAASYGLLDRSIMRANRQASLFGNFFRTGALERFSKNLQWTGRQIEYNFTLPLLLAGGAAVKFALDIERAFTGLKKVYEEVEGDALSLNRELELLAKGVRILSEMFGFHQEEVADVAAAWAQAGASGAQLAKFTRLTMEAAVLGQLSLTDATDGLIAVQAQYRLSTEELSDALSAMNVIENRTTASLADQIRVMQRAGGTARQAGVSIRELGAMTASLVPAIGTAERAGFALNSILTKLMAPIGSARDAFFALGIDINSTAWASQTARERLFTLAEAFDKVSQAEQNTAARAIGTAFQVSRLNVLLQDLVDTNGQYQRAMRETADAEENYAVRSRELRTFLESSPKKWDMLVNRIRNAAAEIGTQLLPAVLAVMNVFAQWARSFADLNPRIQKTVLIVLGLLAAFGTTLRIIGAFGLLFSRLVGLFKIFGHVVGFAVHALTMFGYAALVVGRTARTMFGIISVGIGFLQGRMMWLATRAIPALVSSFISLNVSVLVGGWINALTVAHMRLGIAIQTTAFQMATWVVLMGGRVRAVLVGLPALMAGIPAAIAGFMASIVGIVKAGMAAMSAAFWAGALATSRAFTAMYAGVATILANLSGFLMRWAALTVTGVTAAMGVLAANMRLMWNLIVAYTYSGAQAVLAGFRLLRGGLFFMGASLAAIGPMVRVAISLIGTGMSIAIGVMLRGMIAAAAGINRVIDLILVGWRLAMMRTYVFLTATLPAVMATLGARLVVITKAVVAAMAAAWAALPRILTIVLGAVGKIIAAAQLMFYTLATSPAKFAVLARAGFMAIGRASLLILSPWTLVIAAAAGLLWKFRDQLMAWAGQFRDIFSSLPEGVAHAMRGVVRILRAAWDTIKDLFQAIFNPFGAMGNPTERTGGRGTGVGGGAAAGNVPGFKKGGEITATGQRVPGSGRGDKVPALLEPGEYIVPRSVVSTLGTRFFEALPRILKMQAGGLVPGMFPALDAFRAATSGALAASQATERRETYELIVTISPGAGPAVQDLQSELVRLEAELIAVSIAYAHQEQVVEDAQKAYDVLSQELQDAQDVLGDLQTVANNLSTALDAARTELVDMANTPITGMRAARDAITANEMAQKRLRLEILRIEDSFPAIDRLTEKLEGLENNGRSLQDAIGRANQKIQDLASTPITGMRAMSDAIFENEMAQKKLRLELLKIEQANPSIDSTADAMARLLGEIERLRASREDLRLAGAGSDVLGGMDSQIAQLQSSYQDMMSPAGGGGAQEEIKKLQDELENLRREGEILDLENALKFDPLTRQIDQLVNGMNELPFATIMAGIRGQQSSLEALNAAYADNQQQIASTQEQLTAEQAKRDALLDPLREQLALLERQNEILNLEYSLTFDPLVEQLQRLVDGYEEMPFDQIVAGIQEQQLEVGLLEAAWAAADSAVTSQQAVVDALILRQEEAERVLNAEQAALQVLGDEYDLINEQIQAGNEALSEMARIAQDAIDAAKEAAETASGAGAGGGVGDLGPVGEFEIPGGTTAIGFEPGDLEGLIDEWETELEAGFDAIDPFAPIRERWEQLKSWFAERGGILGVLQSAFTGVVDWVSNLGSSIRTALEGSAIWGPLTEAWEFIQPGLIEIWNVISKFATDLADMLVLEFGQWGPTIASAFEAIKNIFTVALAAIALIWQLAWPVFVQVLSPIFDAIVGIIGGVLTAVRGVIEVVSGVINTIFSLITGDWTGAWEAFKGVIGGLVTFVSGIFSAIASIIDGTVSAILGIFTGLWDGLVNVWNTIYDFLIGNSIVPDIVNGITGWFENLASWLGAVWEGIKTVIATVWNAIKLFLSTVISGIILVAQTMWNGYVAYLTAIWNGIKATVEFVWNAIKSFFTTTWNAISTVATTVFDGIKNFISTTWDNIKQKFTDVQTVVKAAWDTFWGNLNTKVRDIWEGVKSFISTTWDNMKQKFTDATTAAKTTWDTFWGNVDSKVRTIWGNVSGFVSTTWENIKGFFNTAKTSILQIWDDIWTPIESGAIRIKDNLIGAFEDVRDGIVNAFTFVKDSMGGIWDGIKGAIETPVNWVIRTAYNNGIMLWWNKIADKVPFMGPLSSIDPIGLNRGGRVPGTGSQDTVPAMLTPGEFVFNKKAASRIPDAVLESVNSNPGRFPLQHLRFGRTGGDYGDFGVVQRFQEGGFVKSPDEVLDWGRTQRGPWVLGGFGPTYDCSGFMSALSNYAATGNHRSGGRWATGMATGSNAVGRFRPGKGDPETGFSIGIRPTTSARMGHTAGTITGTNVESASGAGTRVGGPTGWSYGQHRYHLPGFGGPDKDILQAMRDMWDFVKQMISAGGPANITGFDTHGGSSMGRGLLRWLFDVVPFGDKIAELIGFTQESYNMTDAIPKAAIGGIVRSATTLMAGESGPEAILPLNAFYQRMQEGFFSIVGSINNFNVAESLRYTRLENLLTTEFFRRSTVSNSNHTEVIAALTRIDVSLTESAALLNTTLMTSFTALNEVLTVSFTGLGESIISLNEALVGLSETITAAHQEAFAQLQTIDSTLSTGFSDLDSAIQGVVSAVQSIPAPIVNVPAAPAPDSGGGGGVMTPTTPTYVAPPVTRPTGGPAPHGLIRPQWPTGPVTGSGVMSLRLPYQARSFDIGGPLPPGLTMAYNGTRMAEYVLRPMNRARSMMEGTRIEAGTYVASQTNTELHFHGDLSFPNIQRGDDAEDFIRHLESLSGGR